MPTKPAASAANIKTMDLVAANETSAKARIQERIQRAVNAAPLAKNRSPELVPLSAEYEKMKRNLRNLVTLVKRYSERTSEMNAARGELVHHLGFMSQSSPIYEDIGLGLDPTSAEALERLENSSEGGKSIAEVIQKRLDTDSRSLAVVQKFGAAYANSNGLEYEQHVMTYAIEWEQIVTSRVDNEMEHVRKLQGDRDHYQKKVDMLRKRAHELEARGRSSPAAQVDKLQRNENKLKEAFVLYEAEAGRLCALIEAVSRDGWIELYNLCRNYMKWESNRVGRETDTYTMLSGTLDSLKISYKKNSSNASGAAKKGANGKKGAAGLKKAPK